MSTNLKQFVKDIANAIRAKKGTTDPINPQDFVSEIEAMPENKLGQVIDRTITEITEKDLDGVTSIANYAFASCRGLTSITIPDSVISIGQYAFYSCNSLISIVIPNNVTFIDRYAFYHCEYLEEITFPHSITTIKDSAFAYCYLLTKVNYTGTIEQWATYSFSGSGAYPFGQNRDGSLYINGNKVTDVDLTSISSIGDYAFYCNTGIESLKIKSDITFGTNCLYGCTSLKKLDIDNIKVWSERKFGNTNANPLYYAKNLYLNGELVTNLIIPNGTTKVGQYTFYNCSSLLTIEIPNSVTSIETSAFRNCVSVTDIIIDSNITNTPMSIFADCSSLKNVIFGDSCKLTTISSYAFNGCNSLEKIDFSKFTQVPSLASTNTFTNVPTTCQVIIPDALYDTWITATNWSAISVTYVKASEYTEA